MHTCYFSIPSIHACSASWKNNDCKTEWNYGAKRSSKIQILFINNVMILKGLQSMLTYDVEMVSGALVNYLQTQLDFARIVLSRERRNCFQC